MSIANLKEEIISRIQNLDNDILMSEIYELLQIESDESDIYILNKAQEDAIDEALEQVRNGQFMTDKDATIVFKAWSEK